MYTVVHAQPCGKDDVHTRNDVNGHVPEVESAHHVHEGEHDTSHDHQTEVQVTEHHQGHLTQS